MFKKDDNRELRRFQNPLLGEADFNQLLRLLSQLFFAAENSGNMETLSPRLTPTISRDMEEQLKLAHEVVDVRDRANRKNCVTLLLNSVDEPVKYYAKFSIFVRKMEDEDFQQIVYV